jgi:hypothetical protein
MRASGRLNGAGPSDLKSGKPWEKTGQFHINMLSMAICIYIYIYLYIYIVHSIDKCVYTAVI